jgi:hypothetical protein
MKLHTHPTLATHFTQMCTTAWIDTGGQQFIGTVTPTRQLHELIAKCRIFGRPLFDHVPTSVHLLRQGRPLCLHAGQLFP